METTPLDFSSLKQALDALRDGLTVVANDNWFVGQTPEVQKTLIAGVVQSFEFVYELSIKMLRRQLERDADSPEQIDHAGFREMLRMAAEKGLVNDVEAWFKYRQLRNITSHTYNREKAQLVYEQSIVFIRDAEQLWQALDARSHG